ncbi:MAG: hypothetical protein ACM3ZB_16235 [bacterium]
MYGFPGFAADERLSTYLVVCVAPEQGEVVHLFLAADAREARRISEDESRKEVGGEFYSWRLRTAS